MKSNIGRHKSVGWHVLISPHWIDITFSCIKIEISQEFTQTGCFTIGLLHYHVFLPPLGWKRLTIALKAIQWNHLEAPPHCPTANRQYQLTYLWRRTQIRQINTLDCFIFGQPKKSNSNLNKNSTENKTKSIQRDGESGYHLNCVAFISLYFVVYLHHSFIEEPNNLTLISVLRL